MQKHKYTFSISTKEESVILFSHWKPPANFIIKTFKKTKILNACNLRKGDPAVPKCFLTLELKGKKLNTHDSLSLSFGQLVREVPLMNHVTPCCLSLASYKLNLMAIPI